MGNEDGNIITLPEITIIGSPDPEVDCGGDWFCKGFVFGWANPTLEKEVPAPLNEESLDAYFRGVDAGQDAATRIVDAYSSESYDGPAIGPDLGGESFEALEKEWQEAWSHFLNHRHEPHTEIEEYGTSTVQPPQIQIIR